jgi:hypothetical protein
MGICKDVLAPGRLRPRPASGAVVVVLCSLALLAASALPASARSIVNPPNSKSPTVVEAGYDAATASASSASDTFHVPKLTCTSASSAYDAVNLEQGDGSTAEAVASLIGRCTSSTASYIFLCDFPAQGVSKYLTLTFTPKEEVDVSIKSSGDISVTAGGTTQSASGHSFSVTDTVAVVVVYPAIVSKDTRFSKVKFTAVKISGNPLGGYSTTKLTGKRGKKVIDSAGPITGGDAFTVSYG